MGIENSEKLNDACETVIGICRLHGIHSLDPELETVSSLLGNDHDKLEVAVLGRFKSGKSSMLNWLAGEEIAPVNALPATAIITRVELGHENAAKIEFADGHTEAINVDRLADYVTERGNPKNEKHVLLANVRTPGLASWPGIRFVDTPGTGSIYAHNTEVAGAWIPRVAAAIITTSAENPASEQDMNLLRETSLRSPEIMVVLTKADLLQAADLLSVLEFVRNACAQVLGHPVPVFPFSVKSEASHFTSDFVEHLRAKLETNRQASVSGIVIHRLKWIVTSCRSYLEVGRAAQTASAEQRQRLLESCRAEHTETRLVGNELRLLFLQVQSKMQAATNDHFLTFRKSIADRVIARFRAEFPKWRGHFGKIVDQFTDWLSLTLRSELERLIEGSNQPVTPFVAEAGSIMSRTVRAFQDRLRDKVSSALGIELKMVTFSPRAARIPQPDIRIARVFDSHIDLYWFVIPMWLFRPLVRRHFEAMIDRQVEINLYRLGSDVAGEAGRMVDEMASHANTFMQNELNTIESLSNASPTQHYPFDEEIAALKNAELLLVNEHGTLVNQALFGTKPVDGKTERTGTCR